ncbi:MAG: Tat pathway signal protein [Hyphomicrobiaceae bacterium]|nr:Tat pathway signal protein [Hyphomicrobiaceae bacterium]
MTVPQASRAEPPTPSTYEAAVRLVWRPLDPAGGLGELVRAATLAANSHNTQPWRFKVAADRIGIHPDPARRCPAVDPDDHHLFATLGCAAENVVQAAGLLGLRATPRFDGAADAVVIDIERGAPVRSALGEAIIQRQCTRAAYDGRPVSTEDLRMMQAAGSLDGVECLIVTETARIEGILEYIVQGNTAQMRDPAFMAELTSWIRFNDATAIAHMDGLSARSTGNPTMPPWLARRLLPFVLTETGENDKYAKQVRSSAGLAVLIAPSNDKAGWVAAGRAYERFALQATALDIRHAFLNQPVEVPSLRPKIAAYLGRGDRRLNLIVRFGRGPTLPYSLRRPVSAVMDPA